MKQRQLTQEEIDMAPEWARFYSIHKSMHKDDICFESNIKRQWLIGGRLLSARTLNQFGIIENAQPIPRKAFDVANHRFSVVSLINSVVMDNDIATLFFEFDKQIDLTKADSIAIAKALGVTAEDLNTHPTS